MTSLLCIVEPPKPEPSEAEIEAARKEKRQKEEEAARKLAVRIAGYILLCISRTYAKA